MKKLLPVILALLGLGGGAGAGLALRPHGGDAGGGGAEAAPHGAPAHEGQAAAPAEGSGPGEDAGAGHEAAGAVAPGAAHEGAGAAAAGEGGRGGTAPAADAHGAGHEESGGHGEAASDFVKLNNQFVVPVVTQGRVSALVIMALSVEVSPGGSEQIYAREPKLRDALLQVMFDHANAGGFDGVFTDGANLVALRTALTEAASKVMGGIVRDVLISDISRQDS